MLDTISSLTSLGGTVVTVVLFLWYLKGKDSQAAELSKSVQAAQDKNTETMARSVGKNTEVLQELNKNLALQKEALKSVCRAGN